MPPARPASRRRGRAASRREVRRPERAAAAFTLVEVMIAAIVLVLGISTAILTLQRGFQSLDTARNLTHASQVMQSELERLRLKSWTQVEALQGSGDTTVAAASVTGMSGSFRCTRTIRDLKTDMKEITLESVWNGYDGRSHTVRYMTRYSKSGLYDYFYTAH